MNIPKLGLLALCFREFIIGCLWTFRLCLSILLNCQKLQKKRFVRYWMSLANFLRENSPHGLIRPIVLGIEP